MSSQQEAISPEETMPLLPSPAHADSEGDFDADIESLLSKDEDGIHFHSSATGSHLPFNNYTTIDWLRSLAADSARHRRLRTASAHATSIRGRTAATWDALQGWMASMLIGVFTAFLAYGVDMAVETVADWKEGHCSQTWWLSRKYCCSVTSDSSRLGALAEEELCDAWMPWQQTYRSSYAVYVGFALLFGILAGAVTMLTRQYLPAGSAEVADDEDERQRELLTETASGKVMFMAAGSGIPEIKTILSGFEIPNLLDFKVLVVKAVGAIFAVSTGMCLGKEGPFVHISTCVGYIVSRWFHKYRTNERKLREMLSVACSSGLSVAFGAPLGGVLFSYEVKTSFNLRPCLSLSR
jgi:chloride channel 3/4/5